MIRRMEVKDIDAVVSLEMSIFNESLGEEMFNRELSSNLLAYYYVYELDNEVIGYLSSWVSDMAGEILNFCVKKEYQGYGYGKELLDYFLKEVKETILSISLEVRESNKKAISLYEKTGFVESHHRKSYYKNGEDAIVMIKKVGVDKC